MTLQTSGPISLGNIQGEFGGTTPTSMSEYLRGGANVPDTPANANIKSSAVNMGFSNYYGGVKADVVNLTAQTLTSPLAATCSYRFLGTGVVQADEGGGFYTLENSVIPTTNAGLYEVFVALVLGTFTAGSSASGSWVAINTLPQWNVQATNGGATPKSCSFDISIRKIGTGTTLDTVRISLTSEANV